MAGGGHGIGKAIALSLARENFTTIICGHNAEHLREAVSEINERTGVWISSYEVEATDPNAVKALFLKNIPADTLDVLVNAVGRVERFGSFADLSCEDWLDAWNLNFMSAVFMIQAALPWLKKSRAPRIVNISSLPARQPGKFNPHYSAAKAALVNLSKHLAGTLARDGILVNCICPGTLKGGGWERNVKDRAARFGIEEALAASEIEREEKEKVPLGRIGTPEDVAELVAFLAGDKANFITGQCFLVDGGATRSL